MKNFEDWYKAIIFDLNCNVIAKKNCDKLKDGELKEFLTSFDDRDTQLEKDLLFVDVILMLIDFIHHLLMEEEEDLKEAQKILKEFAVQYCKRQCQIFYDYYLCLSHSFCKSNFYNSRFS